MPFLTVPKTVSGALETTSLPFLELWRKLAITTGQADPVCCAPNWNIAFHEIFHPRDRLFYLADVDSLALFCERPTPGPDVYLTPVEDSWMFGQPLLGFYAPELLEEAMDIFAAEYAGKTPVVVLSGIQAHRPQTLKLFTLFSRHYNFYRYNSIIECAASLAGGLDGWLGRRSANHRAKLKKAMRKAADRGIYFERWRPDNPRTAAEIFHRMLVVERKSWKGMGQCGMAETPSREFYASLLGRHAMHGNAYVMFARMDDEDIGFIFGGACGPIYRGQQFSYDYSMGSFSVGNLMQLKKIEWLCEEGFTRYDMGPITGSRMGYKAHWTEQNFESETWIMKK